MSLLATDFSSYFAMSGGTLHFGEGASGAVPEPATWLLLLFGAIGVLGVRKNNSRERK